jgi:hypothetical protein
MKTRKYQKPRIDRAQAAYQTVLLAGVLIRVAGDELAFDPAAKMTPLLRRLCAANKAGLIALLRANEQTVDDLLGKTLDAAKELSF